MPLTVPDRFHNVSLSGNTAGVLAEVSSGTLTLAGGNNVTLSQAGNAITISGASQSTHAHSNLSAGISTLGNTSGNTGLVTGQLVLAGGNNITLSGSTNAGSITITVSGANVGGAQTGISGIANSETTYTSGSVTLSALGAITIRSTTGQQFQFSVNSQTIQSNTIGMSNIGNTAGDTAIRSASQLQIVLAGGNNVTLSQSTAGSSATITISGASVPPIATTVQSVATANSVGTVTRFAPEDHRHVGIAQAQISGNTSNTSNVVQGSLVLAGGNNITLSQVSAAGGATITISGPNVGGAQTGISGIANSETTYTSGSVTLSALGAVTIRSTTGQHFQISVAAQTVESNTIGMSNIGNTAGDTAIRSAGQLQIVLAGGNNITLSQSTAGSSATITISAANETQTVPPIATTVQSVATANSVGTVTRFAPEDHRHAGIAQAQISGNTSNTSNVVLGSLVLAGGNNITLSQVSAAGAATITISAANETQTVPPIATTVQSVATANSVGTVTRFAPEDHRHVGVAQAQISGNTSNTSNVIQGSLVLAGGNNITLSQVSAAGGATITISGPNVGGAQTGISGIANSETTYTSGSVTLSALGAVTIRSTTGQHFQISVAAQTVESNTIGMSNIGNTAGDTAIRSAGQLQIVLAGGNNITLSQSTNGSSATITVSAFNQTVESNTIGMSNIGNTAGDTAIRSAGQLRIVFAGGNNITLSQSTNGSSATITISGPNVGGAQTGISGIANSETTYTSGSVTLSALGAVTIRSTTGQHFQISVAAQTVESNTIGMSNIGNTAGDTAIRSAGQLQIVLAGGNNITLSQSTNGSSATITVSAFNQTVESNTIGMSNIGNTAGDTAIRSAGQLQIVLAGGNNITLSQSTNGSSATITVSAFNQTVESNTIGMSNIGNTAGDTAIRSAGQLRIVFAGGNNITLSQSTNGSSATITVSAFNQTSPIAGAALQSVSSATDSGTATSRFAAEDHKHAGVGPAGVSNIGNTAGDTGTQYGRVIFAGGNNITLSVSSSNNGAQTITISAPNIGAGAGYTAGMSNLGNTSGTTGVADSRLVIVGGNNITISQSLDAANHSGTITISAFNQTSPIVGAALQSVSSATDSGTATSRFAAEDHKHAGVGPFGVSNIGNTLGDTGTQYGRVVLAGGDNITLSVSSSNNGAQTISISANGDTLNYWQMVPGLSFGATGQHGQSSLIVIPLQLPQALQMDRAIAFVTASQSSQAGSSYAIAIDMFIGIYTKNASTLSLHTSGSTANAWTVTAGNTTANQAGIRQISAVINATLTPGDYWMAFMSITRSTQNNWATITNMVYNGNNSNFSGQMGVALNSTQQPIVGFGTFTAQTAALPASIAFSHITGAGGGAQVRSQPLVYFMNGSV